MTDKLSFEDMKEALLTIVKDWYHHGNQESHADIYAKMKPGKRNRNLKAEHFGPTDWDKSCPVTTYLSNYSQCHPRFDFCPGATLFDALIVRDFISEVGERFVRRWLKRFESVTFDDIYRNSVLVSDFMHALKNAYRSKKRREFVALYRPELVCIQHHIPRAVRRPAYVTGTSITVEGSFWSPVPVIGLIALLSASEALVNDIRGYRYNNNSRIDEACRLQRLADVADGIRFLEAARMAPAAVACNGFIYGNILGMNQATVSGHFGSLEIERGMKTYVDNAIKAVDEAHKLHGDSPWSLHFETFKRLWAIFSDSSLTNRRDLRSVYFGNGQMLIIVHDLKLSIDNFHHLYGKK